MKKDPLIFIEHILESITNIEEFMDSISEESFLENKEKQSAVIRQIEIIGEAAKNLPTEFKNKYQYVEWKDIVGMRDKLMHHYFGVNLDTVWDVIAKDIPDLKQKILIIKDNLQKQSSDKK